MNARDLVDELLRDPERLPYVLGWLVPILDGSPGFPARDFTLDDLVQAVEASAHLAGGETA